MIGVIDSGIGGTSIKQEIEKLMPETKIIYFRDSKNFPYGNKTIQVLNKILLKNSEELVSKGCKVIVLACNSGSVSSLNYLRSRLKVTVVGVVPALKPAVKVTKTRKIALFATPVTCKSKTTNELISKYCQGVKVYKIPFKSLASLIETNNTVEAISEVRSVWEKYRKLNIDTVVLGCTHYPLIKKEIKKVLGSKIRVVEPSLAVAKQVKTVYNKLVN